MRSWTWLAVLLMGCPPPPLEEPEPVIVLGEVSMVGVDAGVLELGVLDGHLAHLVGTSISGNELVLGAVTLQNTTTARALLEITATVPGYTRTPDQRDDEIASEFQIAYTVAPTLDPRPFRDLTEPTEAELQVDVLVNGEPLETASGTFTVHPPGRMTWVQGPNDMRALISTLVTPGADEMEAIIRRAEAIVPDGGLNGYDHGPEGVIEEMAAIYQAFVENGQTFDTIDATFFDGPQQLTPLWRFQDSPTTVVDGCLALASAFEAIGLETYLFYTSDHMLVGARSSPGGDFYVIDPSVAGTGSFNDAAAEGVRRYEEAQPSDPAFLGIDLAAARDAGIAPMQ